MEQFDIKFVGKLRKFKRHACYTSFEGAIFHFPQSGFLLEKGDVAFFVELT